VSEWENRWACVKVGLCREINGRHKRQRVCVCLGVWVGVVVGLCVFTSFFALPAAVCREYK
jgi:hypothetical protein